MRTKNVSVIARAVGFLSRREYTRRELRQKLLRAYKDEADENAIDTALDTLEARGYLSEERFAQALVRSKSVRYGSGRLRQSLREAGVSEETIEAALVEARETEPERLKAVWVKRFGKAPTTYKEKASQVRFLLSRGFSLALILKTIPEIDQSDD